MTEKRKRMEVKCKRLDVKYIELNDSTDGSYHKNFGVFIYSFIKA